MSEAFTSLSETFRRLSVLGEVSGVLHWDAATMMPEGVLSGQPLVYS